MHLYHEVVNEKQTNTNIIISIVLEREKLALLRTPRPLFTKEVLVTFTDNALN